MMGPWCELCGHSSSYHAPTWCLYPVGSVRKEQCDCDHYAPHVERVTIGDFTTDPFVDDRTEMVDIPGLTGGAS